MGRPVWRDVLEQIAARPARTRDRLPGLGHATSARSHRLWGRIAAKEAARRLWHAAGPPADLSGRPGDRRRSNTAAPTDSSLATRRRCRCRPSRSRTCDGVAVAIAALDPGARSVSTSSRSSIAPTGFRSAAFTPGEQVALGSLVGLEPGRVDRAVLVRQGSRRQGDRDWASSGEAVACEIVDVDEDYGRHRMSGSAQPLAAALAGRRCRESLRVVSARRGDYAWAWTLGEGVEP